MNAWLHRHGKRSWQFTANPAFGELVHITSRGTVYAIFASLKKGKPFWIGRRAVDAAGRVVWLTCEKHLRATSIEFEGSGWYRF